MNIYGPCFKAPGHKIIISPDEKIYVYRNTEEINEKIYVYGNTEEINEKIYIWINKADN